MILFLSLSLSFSISPFLSRFPCTELHLIESSKVLQYLMMQKWLQYISIHLPQLIQKVNCLVVEKMERKEFHGKRNVADESRWSRNTLDENEGMRKYLKTHRNINIRINRIGNTQFLLNFYRAVSILVAGVIWQFSAIQINWKHYAKSKHMHTYTQRCMSVCRLWSSFNQQPLAQYMLLRLMWYCFSPFCIPAYTYIHTYPPNFNIREKLWYEKFTISSNQL